MSTLKEQEKMADLKAAEVINDGLFSTERTLTERLLAVIAYILLKNAAK